MNQRVRILVVLMLSVFGLSCAHGGKADKSEAGQRLSSGNPLIKHEYKKDEISKLCDSALAEFDSVLGDVEDSYHLDTLLTDLSDELTPVVFMAYVSTDANARDEASKCEEKYSKFMVDVFTRRELYEKVKPTQAKSPEDEVFLREMRRSFEQNGMALSDEKLAAFKKLKAELAELEAQFSKNLNEDTTTVEFSSDELKGVTESFLQRLKKSKAGKYIVTTKSTDYIQVMENASNPKTRERMERAYSSRAGIVNSRLLAQAANLRAKLAAMLGKKTWAEYRIEGRMATSPQEVLSVLNGLQKQLKPRLEKDKKILLEAKRQMESAKAKTIESWDTRYFTNQVKKRDYSLDDEEIREYFPKDHVMAGVFDIYSKILGVKFREIKNAKTWSEGVSLYETRDAETGEVLSYFFTDYVPRTGKYGHAAAFTLIQGRQLPDGTYSKPISAVVANFTPPAGGKPSLLTHDEVETLFHEFGHIMHQTLTTVPHGSVSGTSTARDFVEAPSQMLENWVWDAEMLKNLSGHYKDTKKKLPDALIEKMLAAKDFQQGYFYSRQIMLGKTDLAIHMSKNVKDVNKVYERVYRQTLGIEPLKDTQWMAGFGHMMGGYDSGYYGYIWSEVYAQDMFTAFEKAGLLNEEVGRRYRTTILEQGGMYEAMDLITEFLGRKPNNEAFLRKLGIGGSTVGQKAKADKN